MHDILEAEGIIEELMLSLRYQALLGELQPECWKAYYHAEAYFERRHSEIQQIEGSSCENAIK